MTLTSHQTTSALTEAARRLAEAKRNLEATRTECAEHLRISAELRRLTEATR